MVLHLYLRTLTFGAAHIHWWIHHQKFFLTISFIWHVAPSGTLLSASYRREKQHLTLVWFIVIYLWRVKEGNSSGRLTLFQIHRFTVTATTCLVPNQRVESHHLCGWWETTPSHPKSGSSALKERKPKNSCTNYYIK